MDLQEIQRQALANFNARQNAKEKTPQEILKQASLNTAMIVELARILLDEEKFKLWSDNVATKLEQVAKKKSK